MKVVSSRGTRSVFFGLSLTFLFVLGLALGPGSALASDLKPMTNAEMSNVTGQSESISTTQLTTLIRRTDRHRIFQSSSIPKTADGSDEIVERVMRGTQGNITQFTTLPVSVIQAKLMAPRLLMKPETREIITSETFLESARIAGEIAKMFQDV